MYGYESWKWALWCIWAAKNWCLRTVVLEKTLESPLDSTEIKPVNPKGNQSWIFIGRTDAKAEAPIVWPPDSKSWLTGKDPDAGEDWRQKENGQRRMRWSDSITDSVNMNLSQFKEIDAFELWCWSRHLRVPWTARRSNQSILKEINPEYSLEGLMLKLKLQYLGHLMWRADSLEKTLMLGKTESKRGWQRTRGLDGITDSMDKFEQAPENGEGQGSLACCNPWGRKESDTT